MFKTQPTGMISKTDVESYMAPFPISENKDKQGTQQKNKAQNKPEPI